MSDNLVTLVLLLMAYAALSTHSKVHYYITPSPDVSCPQNPCLTLIQFAANSSNCNGNETSISLVFLPGNHILDRELTVCGADKFSMGSQNNASGVLIECTNQSAKFAVSETAFASIKGLHFIGCGGNTITSVKVLIVQNTIFQGLEGDGRGTALVLNKVRYSKMIENSFIANTPGINSERHYIRELHDIRRLEDDLVSVGGAILAAFSNISLTNSNFAGNKADMGGVLFAYHSVITTKQCTYSHNRAHFGGVLFTVKSLVIIDDSTFSQNAAATQNVSGWYYSSGGVIFSVDGSFNFTNNFEELLGGAMKTYDATFNIFNSTFSNNTATWSGGVMKTLGGSFSITGSIFTDNIAALSGGVMFTDDGFFSIAYSTFTNNTAAYGGVMVKHDGSFSITSTNFSNNIATYSGGVINTHDGLFSITSSYFSNNIAAYYAGGVMETYGGSFSITSSNFSNNIAVWCGGVMETHNGSFSITSSNFSNNIAVWSGGVVKTLGGSFSITGSIFTDNIAALSGGVMFTDDGFFSIANSTFTNNTAADGGVMNTYKGSFNITSSIFSNNTAAGAHGGVMSTIYGTFNVTNSAFINNTATPAVQAVSGGALFIDGIGGVMYTISGSFSITRSNFTHNTAALNGGVLIASGGLFNISNCTFTSNTAAWWGGVIGTSGGAFNITDSIVTNMAAQYGGVIFTFNGSYHIARSTFANNTATRCGGVFYTSSGSFSITSSTFITNTAALDGGVVYAEKGGPFGITTSTFSNNEAKGVGGVINSRGGSLFNITNSDFNNNTAGSHGGIMFTSQCSMHVADSVFHNNVGSLYIFSGNLTLNGHSRFENCVEPSNKNSSFALQEGGAVTSFQSTITFNGKTSLLNNKARQGGAILATESIITLYDTTIAINTAIDSNGGGISLQGSELEIKRSCIISNNYAMRGGGVHATSSTITVYQQGSLQFINNSAMNGSGLYLEINPKLYFLGGKVHHNWFFKLIFTDNKAKYGGAIYVADDTNFGTCSPNIECFFQVLSLVGYQILYGFSSTPTNYIQYSGNIATEQGPNLFGGLLDRCVPSSFAEVYKRQPGLRTQYYSGIDYLKDLSNITLDSIASLPVRVCFCSSESEPDCSYQPPPIKVKKGETFNVSLVAVDQANHSVVANIISSPDSLGSFSGGQQTQTIGNGCTNLTFNVFSPQDYESINVFADGPCGSSELSMRKLDIQFLNCTCPVGFQPSDSVSTRCECICDSGLFPYITNCNYTTSLIIRESTNSWITYINDTDPPGYVIHPNCPFDYCQPQAVHVNINLNLPNGENAQCAYNRRGTLCGGCQEYLSLSLGSSHCLPCPSHWPAVFSVVLLAAIIAGILLVAALLALDMTVAIGLINGFIFYANIVAANSAVFFPSSEPSFPTVFVAWLNLDLGIDVCFFDGLDTYTKTWLQLAFPVYIISLVIIIIIISEYSSRFATLIGKRDPIATLATLILLSYTKLLSITITALSFAVIKYPDGSQETVWLPDGNVKYFRGKHAALVIVALFIILVGISYTILLLFWQWIVHAPARWKVFMWTRNTKLNAFVTVYRIPYNSKCRYWTGLLLLVRVILYVTASVTVSDNPQVLLLATIILVGGLFLLKSIINLKVYKTSIADVIETITYFNLLALAALSQYNFKTDISMQIAFAYTSTVITFLLLIGVIAYHVYLLIQKKNTTVEQTAEYLLTPVQTAVDEITYSVVEVHKPEVNEDEIEEIQQSDSCRL